MEILSKIFDIILKTLEYIIGFISKTLSIITDNMPIFIIICNIIAVILFIWLIATFIQSTCFADKPTEYKKLSIKCVLIFIITSVLLEIFSFVNKEFVEFLCGVLILSSAMYGFKRAIEYNEIFDLVKMFLLWVLIVFLTVLTIGIIAISK